MQRTQELQNIANYMESTNHTGKNYQMKLTPKQKQEKEREKIKIFKSCKRKVRHANFEQASIVIIQGLQKGRLTKNSVYKNYDELGVIKPYRCNYCNSYHIGHSAGALQIDDPNVNAISIKLLDFYLKQQKFSSMILLYFKANLRFKNRLFSTT